MDVLAGEHCWVGRSVPGVCEEQRQGAACGWSLLHIFWWTAGMVAIVKKIFFYSLSPLTHIMTGKLTVKWLWSRPFHLCEFSCLTGDDFICDWCCWQLVLFWTDHRVPPRGRRERCCYRRQPSTPTIFLQNVYLQDSAWQILKKIPVCSQVSHFPWSTFIFLDHCSV